MQVGLFVAVWSTNIPRPVFIRINHKSYGPKASKLKLLYVTFSPRSSCDLCLSLNLWILILPLPCVINNLQLKQLESQAKTKLQLPVWFKEPPPPSFS
ncbi:hypothetical protein YC2023_121688 [Brassica napus]